MIDLISIEEAYEHLKIDYDADGSAHDVWLAMFIPMVSSAIAAWVKVEERLYVPEIDSNGEIVTDSNGEPVPEFDSSGEPTVKQIVKGAAFLELANLFKNPEGGGNDMPDGYVLSRGATNLLNPLRKPTLA